MQAWHQMLNSTLYCIVFQWRFKTHSHSLIIYVDIWWTPNSLRIFLKQMTNQLFGNCTINLFLLKRGTDNKSSSKWLATKSNYPKVWLWIENIVKLVSLTRSCQNWALFLPCLKSESLKPGFPKLGVAHSILLNNLPRGFLSLQLFVPLSWGSACLQFLAWNKC